jgi:hypothetical protein
VGRLDWAVYELFDTGVDEQVRALPRREARAAYERLMGGKDGRLDNLRALLASDGVAIQRINDWFVATVEEDAEHPGWLLPRWYSVVNDLGLFLGDVMIQRNPGLHWTFNEWGPKSADYQHHVVMGFNPSPTYKVGLNVDQGLAMYAHRLVRGIDSERDQFAQWLALARRRCEAGA